MTSLKDHIAQIIMIIQSIGKEDSFKKDINPYMDALLKGIVDKDKIV